MSLKTKASVARPGSRSLRATIPEGIVAFLDIKEGDKLDWRMDIQNGERVVVVKKIKGESKNK
jgi:bifunctional DNA-binding transcriptional regulator/antitoxin component of YhaV-PrlF toxin-antitoxin module